MFDVITIGGATRDIFLNTKEGKVLEDKEGKLLAFEYGAKIIPEEVSFSYGGGAVNSAISFSRLGFKTATLINIGKEGTGSLLTKILREDDVETKFITRDDKYHTALSVIISSGKDHTMFLYRDANERLKILDWESLSEAKWLYVTSLNGEATDILKNMPDFLDKHNTKFAWNPGSEQIERGASSFSELLKRTEVLVLNKAEAKEFLKTDEDDEDTLLKNLKNFGVETVAITDGANGSYASFEGYIKHKTSQSEKIVETTGAGDAYGSTLVAALMDSKGLDKAMDLATKNAASVVSYIGSTKGLLRKEKLFNT